MQTLITKTTFISWELKYTLNEFIHIPVVNKINEAIFVQNDNLIVVIMKLLFGNLSHFKVAIKVITS